MRFKAGVLGVVVIMIALVGMLLGSWVMSMDVEENEVTKYNALTGIEGLFDSELTPTFTEYSPSTNYTGYYTDDSIVGENHYFDGVNYTPTQPNNYRLNLQPLNESSGSITLGDADDTEALDYFYVWTLHPNNPGVGGMQYTPGKNSCTFYELMQSQNWTQSAITIICPDPVFPSQTGVPSIVTLCIKSDIGKERSDSLLMKEPGVTGNVNFMEYRNMELTVTASYDAAKLNTPILAAKYDGSINQVTLYADREMTIPVSYASPTDTYLVWSGPVYKTSANIDYTLADIPPATYMDPAEGVSMA